MSTSPRAGPRIVYPDSDGKPMADNTLQWEWNATIKSGLDVVFRDRPDVFVAGDLLWYPVEGDPKIRQAPDALVVFGRPKGYRGSYKQWEEGGIAPQVVFETLAPGNRAGEMRRKLEFYDRYGVEEYYIYDPDHIKLWGYLRDGATLRPIPAMDGWTSPRLGVRFDMSGEELRLIGPDGRPFLTHLKWFEQAEQERHRAEQERYRAEQEQHDKESARARAERLAAQLRALGIEPDA